MSNFKSSNKFNFSNEKQGSEYDKPKYNIFKSYNSTPISVKKDFEIKADDFPDLSKQVKPNINNVKSFASLLEKKETTEEIIEVEEEEIVPPGWSYYKYTKFKNGMCGDICSNVVTKIQKPLIQPNYEAIKQKQVFNEAEEIVLALSLLHEKRTNEYKEL